MGKRLVELDAETYEMFKKGGVIEQEIKKHNPELNNMFLTFKYKIRRVGDYYLDKL